MHKAVTEANAKLVLWTKISDTYCVFFLLIFMRATNTYKITLKFV